MIMSFLGWKMFFHWRFIWAKCFFNHLTKVRWSSEFLKKWQTIIKQGFKKTLIKLLVYIYKNVQLCVYFIFIILVTSFNFEAQIIYIWSLK